MIHESQQESEQDLSEEVLPFLKWAGGKRWLVKSGEPLVPTKFNNYIEPFLGSAAVFFTVSPSTALLADTNQDLVNLYRCIRDNHEAVERQLRFHNRNHSNCYYYKVRASNPRKDHTKAARFLYLNRTCWNGLYRVNLKGEFNVPRGTKDSVLLETDDFPLVSDRLRNCEIRCQDFADSLKSAKRGDFVFVDPPYTVKHNHNGFVKYNERIFSWEDQVRLLQAVKSAVSRGAMVTMTNADHPTIRELYGDYGSVSKLARTSIISGNPQFRTATSEVIIRFGWTV